MDDGTSAISRRSSTSTAWSSVKSAVRDKFSPSSSPKDGGDKGKEGEGKTSKSKTDGKTGGSESESEIRRRALRGQMTNHT